MKIRFGLLSLATIIALVTSQAFSSQAATQDVDLCPVKIDSKAWNIPSVPTNGKLWSIATRSKDNNFFCATLFEMSISDSEGVHTTPKGKVYVRYIPKTKTMAPETVITFNVTKTTRLFIDGKLFGEYNGSQTVKIPGRRTFLFEWAS